MTELRVTFSRPSVIGIKPIPDIQEKIQKMIAKGAEAKVYYKDGDTSVIKIRTSIYATLGRAFESIIL